MMDLENLPVIVNWARKNLSLAIMVAIFGVFLYGAYSMIGGYGTKLGESFVGNYGKFTRSVASYTVIEGMMQDYLTKMSASRIGLARFHNSVHDIGNNSLFFVSFETIITAPGVSANLEDVANLPATTYSVILQPLLEEKPVFVYTRDLKQSSLKELAIKRGIKAMLYVPIRDLSNRLVGMISIDWLSENDIPSEKDRQVSIVLLEEAAARIGGYFSAINR